MTSEEKRIWAEELLRQKYKDLGRMPKKDDFDEATRSRIKAYLGPWPRALEIAGLKEARPKMSKRKKRSVRAKSKRFVSLQKSEHRKTQVEELKKN